MLGPSQSTSLQTAAFNLGGNNRVGTLRLNEVTGRLESPGGRAIAIVHHYVENKAAQTSASWLSGSPFQCQIVPQAARSFGQPRGQSAAWGALAGHAGFVFDIE